MSTTKASRPLFGGVLDDVSDIQQVPDHQECWTSSGTGALLVIEILEYQSAVSNEAAAAYFYKDLAESNGIVSTSDLQLTSSAPPTASRSILFCRATRRGVTIPWSAWERGTKKFHMARRWMSLGITGPDYPKLLGQRFIWLASGCPMLRRTC
eukprot:CAMPEP_0168734562 /NCGR_PEP_ID=MMETSP0724-20121128/8878_1 /TAXON_ID=265536 /ORGANISM="Amphiprora sp., Strain CCMP467" /LENGTH=152 /DNA_ID=CAMNT_0008781671 /DNA_START=959 /DNA_END=1421 /DNA_ORIENTATION=+